MNLLLFSGEDDDTNEFPEQIQRMALSNFDRKMQKEEEEEENQTT